jgi:hypothetical protein
MDKYASTVADLMTEMGLEGWDFIGAEALKERRRRFLILVCDVERTLMIFRRPAEVHDFAKTDDTAEIAPVAEPVLPRRVKRPELVAEVAAGARRVQVNVVKNDGGHARGRNPGCGRRRPAHAGRGGHPALCR